MKPNTVRIILLFLLAFLGSGALFGGGVLIISPSGALFGMPLSLLDHSPFVNFLIPGVILFALLGIVPIWVMMVLIKKPVSRFAEFFNIYSDMYWGWTFCIYIAFTLICWIQIEMTFLRSVHWSHSFYMFLAVLILFVTLSPQIRNLFRKPMIGG